MGGRIKTRWILGAAVVSLLLLIWTLTDFEDASILWADDSFDGDQVEDE